MINWLKSIFSQPQPSGSPQTIRLFQTTDRTLSQGAITIVQEGWVVDSKEEQTIRLFEVPEPQVEQCLVT